LKLIAVKTYLHYYFEAFSTESLPFCDLRLAKENSYVGRMILLSMMLFFQSGAEFFLDRRFGEMQVVYPFGQRGEVTYRVITFSKRPFAAAKRTKFSKSISWLSERPVGWNGGDRAPIRSPGPPLGG